MHTLQTDECFQRTISECIIDCVVVVFPWDLLTVGKV